MESRRVLTQALVLLTCCLLTTVARMTSSSLNDDDDTAEQFYAHESDLTRNANQEDLSKLLLKHLRFRQLPEKRTPLTAPHPGFFPTFHSTRHLVDKRQEQRHLVNDLAALLSGLRNRQSESNMRMPSLRFGK